MIQRTFQSICLISLWSSQTFSIIFAKKTQKKMTLLSEKPELRSEFSKFAPDHRFEIKHGNGLKFSNNFASDSNIKTPNVPRKTENPSFIPPDVWSSKVSSRDGSRKDIITLPDEHPHEPWHLLQEQPGLPVALRKSRRQRARERDGFRRHPKPRTKDLGRGKKPRGRPGKRGGKGLRQTLPRGPWERGRDGRGLRSRGDKPRPPWSRRDEPQRPWSQRNRPERPWGRGNEIQRPWDHRRDGQRPWDRRRDRQQLLDQKYKSSELAKRKTRNRLRKKLAEERRAEKLKKGGVSEASRSRKSEGQEPRSTLAWRTTNLGTRVERTTMRYPRTRKDDPSQRSMDEDLIKEWEEGPWTPEAWTRNTWPWGGWTPKPKRT